MKRNVSERRQFFHITEADVFITDIAKNACTVGAIGDRRAGVTDPSYKPRLRFFVQNIKDAFARCAPGLDQLIELMQATDRIVKKRREHQNCDQIAELHRAGQNGVAAKSEHEYRADRFKHRH